MSKVKNGKTSLLTRKQYKMIKKLDHIQMEDWIRTFAANLNNDNMKNNMEMFVSFDEKNRKAIMIALDNTKGIGEKIRVAFLENYDKAINEIIKNDVKGED
jgi:hypothetical protein|nr:MAG TPA: hypothetical protein [Caudoviricetes sp.]